MGYPIHELISLSPHLRPERMEIEKEIFVLFTEFQSVFLFPNSASRCSSRYSFKFDFSVKRFYYFFLVFFVEYSALNDFALTLYERLKKEIKQNLKSYDFFVLQTIF